MKKIVIFIFLVLGFALLVSSLGNFTKNISNSLANKEPIDTACTTYNDMKNYMDDNGFYLLWRGVDQNLKWLELWSDLEDRHTVIVEFEPPKHNKIENVQSVCIVATTKDTTFNVRSMAKLFNWYDKSTKNL